MSIYAENNVNTDENYEDNGEEFDNNFKEPLINLRLRFYTILRIYNFLLVYIYVCEREEALLII